MPCAYHSWVLFGRDALQRTNPRGTRQCTCTDQPSAGIATCFKLKITTFSLTLMLFALGDGQSVDSSKKSKEGKDFFVPWHLPLHRAEGQDAANKIRQSLPSHIDPSEDPADDGNQANQSGPNGVRHGEVDTEKRTVVFQRYYHLFEKGELENLCNEIEGLVVVESFYDKSNWCVVVERT